MTVWHMLTQPHGNHCVLQGVATRAPPDPIEMQRLEQQADRFEELLRANPSDSQVRADLRGSSDSLVLL